MYKVTGRKAGWRVFSMRYEKEHEGGGVGGDVKRPWVYAQEREFKLFSVCAKGAGRSGVLARSTPCG